MYVQLYYMLTEYLIWYSALFWLFESMFMFFCFLGIKLKKKLLYLMQHSICKLAATKDIK